MINDTQEQIPGRVSHNAYTVADGRRWLYGYPVWIGDDKPILFSNVDSMIAYCMKMDAELPQDTPINYDTKRISVCIGFAVRGVDYGPGSVKRHFAGYVPRKAYQY